jgi:hypothetical protein
VDHVSNSVLIRAQPEELKRIAESLSQLEKNASDGFPGGSKRHPNGFPRGSDRRTNTPADPPAHTIQRGDSLYISAAGALTDRPIDGVYSVDVDGYINLGGEYGKVRVAGMTADKAQDAVIAKLSQILRDPRVTISIAATVGRIPEPPHPTSAKTDPRTLDRPKTTLDRSRLSEREVSVLTWPDLSEAELNAKPWPERSEDLPIAIRHADDVKKQIGGLAIEYRFYDSPLVVIPSKQGDLVIPYVLVVSGDHLGRKEYVLGTWPQRDNRTNQPYRTPGVLVAPSNLRINNGDPLEIFIERGDPRSSTRVRVSNILKLKWKVPGAPTADIRYPKDLMAPFSAIHWDDSKPQVEIDKEWYELLGIDGMKASAFVEVAKEQAGDKWQEKFENELPAVMKEAGALSLAHFVLNLRRLSDGREHTFAVQTQDHPAGKRQAVITRRHNLGIDEFHDRAGKPLGGPTLIAPFSGIAWKDGLPRVQLNGVWYDLFAIGGFPADKIIEQAKKTYPQDHLKGFEENLEAILKDLGQKDFDQVELTLRRVESGRVERIILRREDKTYRVMAFMVTGQQIPDKAKEDPNANGKPAKPLTAANGPEPLRKIQWQRTFPHVTIDDRLYALDRINNVLSVRLIEEAKKMRPDDVPGAFKEEWPELMRRLKVPVGDEIELTIVGPVATAGGGENRLDGNMLLLKYRRDSAGEWKISETARLSTLGPAKRLPSERE